MIKYNITNTILSPEEELAIKKIVESGQVINGFWNERLEEEIKRQTDVKYVILCNTCTSALIISLRTVKDLFHKRYVGLPSFTWHSTGFAVDCTFGEYYKTFYDIDPYTWLMNIESANEDVLLPVDTFGNEYIPSIEDQKKIIVVDAAHGFGLKSLGHRGLIECVSFSFTKTTPGGQGGAILTNNKEVADYCRKLKDTYAKMLETSCLITLNSINNFEKNQKRRKEIICSYLALLEIPFKLQTVASSTNHSVFGILLENTEIRTKIIKELDKFSIAYKIYYEPLKKGYKNTDNVYSRILSLPVYPTLNDYEIEYITSTVNQSI